MARFSAALALLAVLATEAAAFPINPRTLAERNLAKRIAQTTIDAPKKWEDACTAAGGADKCNPIAVTAAATLLAAAGPCEQQDSGDAMVDLAKQLNNNQAMITAAQIFIQQPRNSPNSLATPYCQTAPKNDELAGFFQCQFEGSNQAKFSGSDGTVPLGLTALNPAGSCPANPNGPIADGSQLSDIASSPGTPSSGSGSAAAGGSNSTATATASASTSTSSATSGGASGDDESGDDSGDDSDCDGTATETVASSTVAATGVATSAAAATTKAAASGTATASAAGSTSTNFVLANGLDAQKQNLDSLSVKATDSCTDGSFACVQGSMMQCDHGAFVATANCSASTNANTSCFFLPFIAKASVSAPSCVTVDEAESRIANSGATGGIFGNGAKAQGTVPISA
ncbi:hypothetical protein PENSPDRAFT_678628 [Peniophora sp. CONT]|nr:hypothetical protein PENSPDRAFT_678628 [Peniophora sp. CONT]